MWEMKREKKDAMLIAANIIATNILEMSHNEQFIGSLDSAAAVEMYALKYMLKETGDLRQAATILLSALNHNARYPSCAEDCNTESRDAKYLAQRTINSFCNAQQWSMPLMVHALLGNSSQFGSESFYFIYPHSSTAYRDFEGIYLHEDIACRYIY